MSTGLSKRQVSIRFGFNLRLIETLIDRGVLVIQSGCTPLRAKIDPKSLDNLIEGEHYVVCLECGAFLAQVGTAHVKACANLDLAAYVTKHPNAAIQSKLASFNKAKTDDQKMAQSETLKSRFNTPEGEVTRKQISEASIKLQASGYRDQAAEHLRTLNSLPEMREARRGEALARWASGELRDAVNAWQADHWEEVLASAFNARRHNRKKFTRPHAKLKGAILAAGLEGFVTECEVGYYHIDEARSDLRLAIEMDGCYWHGCDKCKKCGVRGTRNSEASKTGYLLNRGWTILHLKEHDVKSDIDGCVCKVRNAVEQLLRAPHDQP